MTTVMCAGTFDVVHPGHLFYLTEAKRFGDRLVVVVGRDSTVERIKKRTPKHDEHQRLENIRGLDLVDKAVLGHQSGSIFEIISEIKPDVICLGYDQHVQKAELEEELVRRDLKARVIRIGAFMSHKYKSSKL